MVCCSFSPAFLCLHQLCLVGARSTRCPRVLRNGSQGFPKIIPDRRDSPHMGTTHMEREKREKNKRKLFTRTGRLLGPHFPRKSQAEPRAKIGHTEAVFESGEVGIALNTIPRLVLDIHECRTWP